MLPVTHVQADEKLTRKVSSFGHSLEPWLYASKYLLHIYVVQVVGKR